MGAYEVVQNADTDFDGLPDSDETGQGCAVDVADAALYATIDCPSNGASYESLPILLCGRIFSSYVDAIAISTDNGATWTSEGRSPAHVVVPMATDDNGPVRHQGEGLQ